MCFGPSSYARADAVATASMAASIISRRKVVWSIMDFAGYEGANWKLSRS